MMSVKMSSRIESGRHSSVRKRPSEEVRDRAHVALGEAGVPGGAGAEETPRKLLRRRLW
jgi:hypothetical protein